MNVLLLWTTRMYKQPRIVLLVFFILTIFFSFGIPRLKIHSDLKQMLPENSRERFLTEYYDNDRAFGSSNAILIGIEAENIYSMETLSYIKNLSDRIEKLNTTVPSNGLAKVLSLTPEEGGKLLTALRSVGINSTNYPTALIKRLRSSETLVSDFGWDAAFAQRVASKAAKVSDIMLWTFYQPPVGKINSIINTDYLTYEDDTLVSKKLVDGETVTRETISGLKDRVHSWDMYEGMIVAKDDSLTAIIVTLETDNFEIKSTLNKELEGLIKNPARGIRVFMAGEPVVNNQISIAITRDIAFMLPAVLLVMIVFLFLSFKTLRGVVYPLTVTIVSIVWTLGTMGYLGVTITLLSSVIPILLMAIVTAYAIHQLNHFEEAPSGKKTEILAHNAMSVGLAIMLSAITTLFGFGSLVIQEFQPIREFGVFTAFGIMVGLIGAMVLLPALLLLGKEDKSASVSHENNSKGIEEKLLTGCVSLTTRHPRAVLLVSGILSLILLIGSFQLFAELDFVKFFKPDAPISQANNLLNQKMAGTKSLSVVLDSDLSDPLERTWNEGVTVDLVDPDVLKAMDQFSKDIRQKYPMVSKTTSFANMVKRIHQLMNEGDEDFFLVPDDKNLISQYLLLFSGDIQTVLTDQHDKLRIILTINGGDSQQIHDISEYAKAYFPKDFQEAHHFQVQITGNEQLYYALNKITTKGNIQSVAICIVLVLLLLILILRSVPMSFIATIPILMALLLDFGILGFFGIPLNLVTAMISSISIGMGVDFSIHFITWYRRELLEGHDISTAIDRTILYKGRAILYNLAIIMGGFLVLLGSGLLPLQQFGGIIALCMLMAATAAIIVVPSLLRVLALKNYKFLSLNQALSFAKID